MGGKELCWTSPLFTLFPGDVHDGGQPFVTLALAGQDKDVHGMNNMNRSDGSPYG